VRAEVQLGLVGFFVAAVGCRSVTEVSLSNGADASVALDGADSTAPTRAGTPPGTAGDDALELAPDVAFAMPDVAPVQPDVAVVPPDVALARSDVAIVAPDVAPDLRAVAPDASPIRPDLAAASCVDGLANGDESDVDCGGATCPACDLGKTCRAGLDCASSYCSGGHCRTAASCSRSRRPCRRPRMASIPSTRRALN
jgi:hypothetical protein